MISFVENHVFSCFSMFLNGATQGDFNNLHFGFPDILRMLPLKHQNEILFQWFFQSYLRRTAKKYGFFKDFSCSKKNIPFNIVILNTWKLPKFTRIMLSPKGISMIIFCVQNYESWIHPLVDVLSFFKKQCIKLYPSVFAGVVPS